MGNLCPIPRNYVQKGYFKNHLTLSLFLHYFVKHENYNAIDFSGILHVRPQNLSLRLSKLTQNLDAGQCSSAQKRNPDVSELNQWLQHNSQQTVIDEAIGEWGKRV